MTEEVRILRDALNMSATCKRCEGCARDAGEALKEADKVKE